MKLTGIYHLWVADIRLKAEFVYLEVILDAVSKGRLGAGLKAFQTG
jgi:hypothetical protein